jgi:hypothetical protein
METFASIFLVLVEVALFIFYIYNISKFRETLNP